jgi:hypothetical protein
MEITCNRCHQAVLAENCYCPVCGLPQLVYATEDAGGQALPAQQSEAVQDAGTIEWKSALRVALMLAVPAGILCSLLSPVGIFGLIWMLVAAAWAVAIYVRNRRPAWITTGAGARIGLVTGLIGGWVATATTGITLYSMRYFTGKGRVVDDFWQDFVSKQMVDQWTSMGVDTATILREKTWLLSAEGRAGFLLGAIILVATGLVFFGTAGGAMGARLLARTRRPEV